MYVRLRTKKQERVTALLERLADGSSPLVQEAIVAASQGRNTMSGVVEYIRVNRLSYWKKRQNRQRRE